MITFCNFSMPIVVEGLGDCYLIYIKEGGMWQNDEACVAKCDGGQWYHITTNRIKSFVNTTYGITKTEK